ncbi:hypothetical protein AVEN_4413-1 [Araneus ventricosus]|uniref:Uncharacterized protein n=1 Tax=Araneus ventricosus TaxID=182803 RepID=A0A4Y2W698_ARAVE|nr:hypothetical protein AVEN_4413-1 [Araneus ventricosus]
MKIDIEHNKHGGDLGVPFETVRVSNWVVWRVGALIKLRSETSDSPSLWVLCMWLLRPLLAESIQWRHWLLVRVACHYIQWILLADSYRWRSRTTCCRLLP